MFLVDTNVWLETILDQERAEEARRFFETTEARLLAITEFSLYSIGIILTRLNRDDAFAAFLSDTMEDSGVTRIRLDTAEMKEVLAARKRFRLDFDDAYQCVAAAKHNCVLVSFDSDLDRTDRGRRTPAQALP
jgi:hypothetical protein